MGRFRPFLVLSALLVGLLPMGRADARAAVAGAAEAPVLLAPDCAAPEDGPLAPGVVLAGCSSGGEGPTTPAATDACVAVPLVDDRCESWIFRHDGGGTGDAAGAGLDGAGVMTASPDGKTVFTAGFTDTNTGTGWQVDTLLFATAADTGAVRFVARYPGSAELDQALPVAVEVSPDGNVVYALLRESTEAFGERECAQKLVAFEAATGDVRWTAQETGSPGTCSRPYDLAVDPRGSRVYVVGTEFAADGSRVGLVTAYETADPGRIGLVAWQRAIEGPTGEALASAVAPASDGSRVYVAGSTRPATNYAAGEFALFGFDAGDGSRVLEASTPVQGNPPAGVAVSPDGSTAFVTGGGLIPPYFGLFDIVTTAFDTITGAQRWQANYEGPRAQIKSSFDSVWYYGPMALSPDGRTVFVAGYSTCMHGVNICGDFVTLAYDAATGTNRWAPVRYTSETELNWLPQIALHPNGSTVYTAGESRHAPTTKNGRVTTVAYDAATGNQQWVGRHSDGQTFFGGAVISPDGGRVFVSGMTADLTDDNAQTAYDAFIVGYPA
jgi:DNA-binding beta-propeller fold protein YncE